MPEEKISARVAELSDKRETAILAYRRAQLAVSEAHKAFVQQLIKEGAISPTDLGSIAMCW